ncbi:hypothetical protein [Paracoccus sp. (in: a-proteobacteria)]|uniref:hypothetical protein n=1 Tax=Paracoccus sp. TaxID=267 RepID=UPI003A882A36
MRNNIMALACAVMAGALALPAAASTVSVVVPGSANPYLAGLPDGTTALTGDSAPGQSPVLVSGLGIMGGVTLTFAATGQVSLGLGLGPDPDGGSPIGHQRGEENGFSAVTMPRVSLLGVFLDDMLPTTTAAPAALNFSPPGSRNYLTLSPLLKQIFFIGDGAADDGTVQQIVAPAGASRLYLGTMDSYGWYNNTGQFNVDISMDPIAPATIPLPAGLLLLLGGLGTMGLLRRS